MNKIIIFVLATFLWILVLLLFKRSRMSFFKFMTGSIGFFLISIIFFVPQLERNLDAAIALILSYISEATGYFHVFRENSIVSFDANGDIISMLIDYECSGIIEMLVFTSLVLFFPFGKTIRKCLMIFGGNLFIYIANIIRVLFIIFVTKAFGSSAFYMAHTLLGRILFFGLMVVLYYYVFTSTHLKYQNVGDLS